MDALARDPASILRRHPTGDDRLAQEAQSIIMSGLPGRFALFLAARSATDAQQEQIGRGAGRAYYRCVRAGNASADDIRDQLQRSGVPRVYGVFSAEVDALLGPRNSGGPVLPGTRSGDDAGSAATLFSDGVPETNMTGPLGGYSLPPLSGPLPNPFDPVK